MFHTVGEDFYDWDAILALVEEHGGYIAAHGKPLGVPRERWCQNISPIWYGYNGTILAQHVNAALSVPDGPAVVMVDELRGGSIEAITTCARWMHKNAPEHSGRWGCYVVDGSRVSYPVLQPAIDALLDANVTIAPEFYPLYSAYMKSATTVGARDMWLADYFLGAGVRNNGKQLTKAGRLDWLMRRRASRGSSSPIRPIFGVIDRFLDGATPAIFLDRMFYVFATRTGYAGLLPGVGSWKWQRPWMDNTSRDAAFRRSWLHYCGTGSRVSRLGVPR